MRAVAACCAILSVFVQTSGDQPLSLTIQRHYTAADRDTGRYQYVPFEVPSGIEWLTIAYRYDAGNGASVVDLGLFEPGPLSLGTASFRGYSGGAQRTITVGRDGASPGYRAGNMPAGRWHVLLGLYKVAPAGVDVEVAVVMGRTARGVDRPVEPQHAAAADANGTSPVGRGSKWYSGALHLHTTHSDGAEPPAAVSERARAAGLDFIAITDHNNTVHAREPMPPLPLHIVGEEVTTPAGHANVWGLPPGGWIDFRVSPAEHGAAAAVERLAAEARSAGGLFAINHPFDVCSGCSWEQIVPEALDAIEVWNGERGPQDQAIAQWDRLLQSGRRVTAIGASDWHRVPAPIEAPAVRVHAAELSTPAILDGIRRGRVLIVRNPGIAAPSIVARCGDKTAGLGDTLTCRRGERVVVTTSGTGPAGERADLIVNGTARDSKPIADEAVLVTQAVDGYLRVNMYTREAGLTAIANPIHVATR